VGVGLASTLQGTMAVLMLTRFSTSAETARFGASLNFIEVTLVLPVLLQRSLLPTFSRLSGTGGAAGIAQNALRLIPAVLIPAGVGMSCLAASIMALYPSGEFATAAPVLRLISLWLVCIGPLHVCGAFLTGMGRLRALIGVNLFGAGIQAVILLFEIPRAGAVGAAASTLVAYALCAAVLLYLVRGSGVAVPWPALARVALASLAMAAVVLPMQEAPLALAVVAGAAVYAIAWWLLLPRASLERRLVVSTLDEVRRRFRN
jgi:O-antigen/teichoic acid export membrane protein